MNDDAAFHDEPFGRTSAVDGDGTFAALSPKFGVWLAAWLYDRCSIDEFFAAATACLVPVDIATWRTVRRHAQGCVNMPNTRQYFSSPGAVSPLADGAYVLGGIGQGMFHVDVGQVKHVPIDAPIIMPPTCAEALLQLNAATDTAVANIAAMGFRLSLTRKLQEPDLSSPLDLPSETPLRVRKVFDRAENVSAIITHVRHSMGDTSLDPFLLPLQRAANTAFSSAVVGAAAEFLRENRTAL